MKFGADPEKAANAAETMNTESIARKSTREYGWRGESSTPATGKRRATEPSVPRGAGTGFLLLLVAFLGLASCDGSPQAGVIATGNSGRISGMVVAENQGVQAMVRLIRVDSARAMPYDTMRTDSVGHFLFKGVPEGSYWVEAVLEGHVAGRSAKFFLDGDINNLLVVLVTTTRVTFNLSSLGPVDSVFLDNRSNPGVRVDSGWQVSALKDSSGVLYTHGTVVGWLSWNVKWQGGTLVITGQGVGAMAPFVHTLDSSAFFLTPRTVALWTFDSATPTGLVLDRGPWGIALSLPEGARLVASPHGQALDATTLSANDPVANSGGTIPKALQWYSTGYQTIEMRVRMEQAMSTGFMVVGSLIGPRISIGASGAVVVSLQGKLDDDTTWNWYDVLTDPGLVPVGRWVDIAVSVDGPRGELYLWMDGVPQRVFSTKEVRSVRFRDDRTIGPFEIGGADWDARVGKIRIDEVKISDTLAYGQGYPRQASWSTQFRSSSGSTAGTPLVWKVNASIATNCFACSSAWIGATGDSVGRFLWKPALPNYLVGRKIIQANLIFWDLSSPQANRVFSIQPVTLPWSVSSLASSPISVRAPIEPAGLGLPIQGLLQANSLGKIMFEVTDLLQSWVDDTASNRGVVLKALDETLPAVQIGTQNAASEVQPYLIVQYR